LQMGWTRSLRYAKYRAGKKSQPWEEPDQTKLQGASVFKEHYDRARTDEKYIELKEQHRQ